MTTPSEPERVKELERAYRQREEALQNLVVFREGERDSALARVKVLEREVAKTFTAAMELRSMAVANGQERDSARAALRGLVYQSEWFESCAEEGSDAWKAYAEARRVLGEGKP